MEIDVKRFYVPGFSLEDKCPNCGALVKYDLSDSYLSYPLANEPMSHSFYCGDCEHEWERMILLTIKVEMLPKET
jgi:hypothetical protein